MQAFSLMNNEINNWDKLQACKNGINPEESKPLPNTGFGFSIPSFEILRNP